MYHLCVLCCNGYDCRHCYPLEFISKINVSIHNTTIQLFPVDFVGFITALTYCSSSFICHFNLLRLQKELKKPTTKLRFYTITITAMLAAYFLYNVLVFAGYFRVRTCYP